MADASLFTPRLELRRWTPHDADDAFAIYRDPEVNRFIGGTPPADRDEMRERIARGQVLARRYPEGMGSWAAVLDGVVVGNALLKPLPITTGEVPPPPRSERPLSADIEVGWHLGRPWWGRGLATEMGERLVRYGFDTLGLAEIHAVVEPPNEASKRVALRCGLRYVGRTRAYYEIELDHFLSTQG